MIATLLSSAGEAITLVLEALLALLLVGLVALVAVSSMRSRKVLRFEPWVAFDGEGAESKAMEGHRAADLLLTEIRDIQRVHKQSGRGLDLDNPYHDVPALQQNLDDVTLLASVNLQSHGPLVGDLVNLLLALMPARPGRLVGSIHRIDGTVALVASIENLRHEKGRGVRQWRIAGAATSGDDLAPLVRDLAYDVYLELATASAFRAFPAFRSYTHGVDKHFAFGEDESAEALRAEAERCYEQARQLEPRNPAVLYNLGVLKYSCYDRKLNNEAIGHFRDALLFAEGKLRAQVHSGLCNALIQTRHRFGGSVEMLRDATTHAEHARRIDRRLDVAIKALAFAHHQRSEALASARHQGSEAHGAVAGADRAARRAIRGHRRRAIWLYVRTIRRNSRYYIAYNNLGNLFLNRAEHEDAPARHRRRRLRIARWLSRKSIEIKPSYWHAHDNAGNACRALGRLGVIAAFDEAKSHYDDALTLRPYYLAARSDLAILHQCAGWPKRDHKEAARLVRATLAEAAAEDVAGFEKRFVKAAREARLDECDSQGEKLQSVLPEELLARIEGQGARTQGTPPRV